MVKTTFHNFHQTYCLVIIYLVEFHKQKKLHNAEKVQSSKRLFGPFFNSSSNEACEGQENLPRLFFYQYFFYLFVYSTSVVEKAYNIN